MILECGRSFHFLVSSSVSFFRDLKFITEPLPLLGFILDVYVLWSYCGWEYVHSLSLSVNGLRGGTGHEPLNSQGGGGGHRDTGLSGVCYCIGCVLFPSKESKEASVRPPSIYLCHRPSSAIVGHSSLQPASASVWPCSIKILFMGIEI